MLFITINNIINGTIIEKICISIIFCKMFLDMCIGYLYYIRNQIIN